MNVTIANKISPALKIASSKNYATCTRSDNMVTWRSRVNRAFNRECGLRETRRDEASNAAEPRETIKGRHTMRMCVSRDKNLESRVTRNWRCELTADLAPIASASRCVIKHVPYSTYAFVCAHIRYRIHFLLFVT